ncbi:MAG: BrnT family toxin [Rhodothermales bacterium]
MEFEWDEAKNQINLLKHGIGFDRARAAFDNACLIREDDRQDYGEQRWQALGVIEGTLVLLVAFTRREDSIRIISARKANERERRIYHAALPKGTDPR